MSRLDVVQLLTSLPRLEPEADWKQRAKERLLVAYDHWFARMTALRHWALYVSSKSDATEVASAIVARGASWRPVTVAPERMRQAVETIRPALVVIDSELPGAGQLLERVRLSTVVTAVTDDELLHHAA